MKQEFDPQEMGNDASFVKWRGKIIAWLAEQGRSAEQLANTVAGIHHYVAVWEGVDEGRDWTIEVFALNPQAAVEAIRRKEPHFAEAIENGEAGLGRRQVVPVMVGNSTGVDVDRMADIAERHGLVSPDMQGPDPDDPRNEHPTAHGWVITAVYDDGDNGLVGLTGPGSNPFTAEQISNHPAAIPFRMLDDDDITYADGFLLPPLDEVGAAPEWELSPLDDYGEGNWGCTQLRNLNDQGVWETING